MTDQVVLARRAVAYFRRIGLVPLPSREDRKGPALSNYSKHWTEPVPESVYEHWSTRNVQLITGTKSPGSMKIAVIDCDGAGTPEKWKQMCEANGHEPAGGWVALTGSGGYHLYYRLPDSLDLCTSRRLWGLWDTFGSDGKGDWAKHQEIRLLADQALVIAPPSIHVGTGQPYRFLKGAGPKDRELGEVPAWILRMPAASPCPARPAVPQIPRTNQPKSAWMVSREEVLARIPDKISLARTWGLRLVGAGPNGAGWQACHAAGRVDKQPSGRISIHGVYQDRRDSDPNSTCLSLFDLGVLLGQFATWQECCERCAQTFV